MSTFKVKDVMITLGAREDYLHCPAYTGIVCHFGCSIHITPNCHFACSVFISPPCHFGCSIITPHGCQFHASPICPTACSILITPICRFTLLERRDFSEVEFKQLKEEMAELQKGFDSEFKPQTLEELNQLEEKLNQALADIKTQKASFKK